MYYYLIFFDEPEQDLSSICKMMFRSRKLRMKQSEAKSTCAADSVRSISSPEIFTTFKLQTLGVCPYQLSTINMCEVFCYPMCCEWQ